MKKHAIVSLFIFITLLAACSDDQEQTKAKQLAENIKEQAKQLEQLEQVGEQPVPVEGTQPQNSVQQENEKPLENREQLQKTLTDDVQNEIVEDIEAIGAEELRPPLYTFLV